MQITAHKRSLAGGIGAALLVAGLTIGVTQTDAAQRGPGGPGGRMGGGPMGGRELGAVMRDLTDAQRDQVKAIRERHAERIRPLAERAHAAREALNAAAFAGNTGNLQALSIEVGSAETELAFAQAQVQAEVFAILTPQQKQQITERRQQIEQRRSEMMKRRQQRPQQ